MTSSSPARADAHLAGAARALAAVRTTDTGGFLRMPVPPGGWEAPYHSGKKRGPRESTSSVRRCLPFTTSVRRPGSSSCRVDDAAPRMSDMDIVAVILGVISFALLYALLEGIDRI